MTAPANRPPSAVRRFGAIAQLIYIELQYWLLGLTPERYHWSIGSAWETLGDYRRASKHLARYLENSENTYVRTLLGYCYARLGDWVQAASHYAAACKASPHASVALALAEAEFHLGNAARARELIGAVESEHASLTLELGDALAALKTRLESASVDDNVPTTAL